MAVSVRIEDEAFCDERYVILAKHCGLSDADHARGKMMRLWRQCTLEGVYDIDTDTVVGVLGDNGVAALLKARLGEDLGGGMVRIKGTKGRIEWLARLRENGKKGGRSKKEPDDNQDETIWLPGKEPGANPPAPAPAPAPVSKSKSTPLAPSAENPAAEAVVLQKIKRALPVPTGPVVLSMPTNTGEEWPIDLTRVHRWSESFPAVNITQELRNAREWCLANPANRKTVGGMERFLVRWLTRAQDRAPRAGRHTDLTRGGQEMARAMAAFDADPEIFFTAKEKAAAEERRKNAGE